MRGPGNEVALKGGIFKPNIGIHFNHFNVEYEFVLRLKEDRDNCKSVAIPCARSEGFPCAISVSYLRSSSMMAF